MPIKYQIAGKIFHKNTLILLNGPGTRNVNFQVLNERIKLNSCNVIVTNSFFYGKNLCDSSNVYYYIADQNLANMIYDIHTKSNQFDLDEYRKLLVSEGIMSEYDSQNLYQDVGGIKRLLTYKNISIVTSDKRLIDIFGPKRVILYKFSTLGFLLNKKLNSKITKKIFNFDNILYFKKIVLSFENFFFKTSVLRQPNSFFKMVSFALKINSSKLVVSGYLSDYGKNLINHNGMIYHLYNYYYSNSDVWQERPDFNTYFWLKRGILNYNFFSLVNKILAKKMGGLYFIDNSFLFIDFPLPYEFLPLKMDYVFKK